MQNLPINATPAVTPATPVPATGNDANPAPASETFGSVLARQRANTSNEAHDSKQTSATPGDKATEADATDTQQTATTNLLGMLPGNMLATLLPATASDTMSVGKDSHKVRAMAVQETQDASLIAADASSIAADRVLSAPPAMPAIPVEITAGKQAWPAASNALNSASSASSTHRESAIHSQALAASQQTPVSGTPDALNALHTDTAEAAPVAALTHNENAAFAASQADMSAGVNIAPQAMAALATQPGTPVQVAVNTPVGQDAWADDFNQSVTWLASQHEQSAQLHLNPPNLGPLDVVLNVSDGQATALFTSPHAAVRDAIEQALPKLREMLADNGITLGNAMVSDQSPRDQSANFTNNQLKGTGVISDKDIGAAEVAVSAVSIPERRHLGMVDTFA